MYDVSKAIAAALHAMGKVKSDDPSPFSDEELNKIRSVSFQLVVLLHRLPFVFRLGNLEQTRAVEGIGLGLWDRKQ